LSFAAGAIIFAGMDVPADLAEFARFAGRLADAARAETLPRFRAGTAASSKVAAGFDPVTDADREAERALRRMIETAYPEHGIVGEEFGCVRADAAYRWVLDPVDGTRGFLCGAPTWATLIGLERGGVPVIGVIDQPFSDERWLGVAGGATYRRRGAAHRCAASGVVDLACARVSTTDPRCEGYFTRQEADAFARLAQRCRVCRFSLDAYAYGLLALGEVDLVVEAGLQRHDIVALVPVVEGAGGRISGWKGESPNDCARGRLVAAATPQLHAAALDLLRDL
jgi:myo-inositol-1(or 4)-monophosphatase